MNHYHRYSTGSDVYPQISGILAPEYGEMPAEVIEELIARKFGEDVSPEDMEFSIGSALRAAGNVAQQVLPVVAPIAGTVVGTAIGGPVGAAIGGRLGTAAGQAIAPGMPAQPVTAAPGMPAQPVTMPQTPAGQIMPAGDGSTSVAQLLQLLSNPVALQALFAMLMGGAGRPSLMAGQTPAPPAAIANTIASLASQAAAEYNAVATGGEAVPRYLLDERGEFLCDPAVPEQRATVLMQRLNEAAGRQYWARDEDYGDYDLEVDREEDLYDEMDLIDLYADDWED